MKRRSATPGAARSLNRGGLAEFLGAKLQCSSARVRTGEFSDPAVDDHGDAVDGHGGLRDIRGEDQLLGVGGGEGPLLQLWAEVSVESMDLDAVPSTKSLASRGCGVDVEDAREEGQNMPVAASLDQVLKTPEDLPIQRPRAVGAVVEVDGVLTTFDVHDLRVEEVGDGIGVHGGGHGDDAQRRQRGLLEVADPCEGVVRVEVTFVKLIKDDDIHGIETPRVSKRADEEALRHKCESCVSTSRAVKSNLVAHSSPHGFTESP